MAAQPLRSECSPLLPNRCTTVRSDRSAHGLTGSSWVTVAESVDGVVAMGSCFSASLLPALTIHCLSYLPTGSAVVGHLAHVHTCARLLPRLAPNPHARRHAPSTPACTLLRHVPVIARCADASSCARAPSYRHSGGSAMALNLGWDTSAVLGMWTARNHVGSLWGTRKPHTWTRFCGDTC